MSNVYFWSGHGSLVHIDLCYYHIMILNVHFIAESIWEEQHEKGGKNSWVRE